MSTRYCDSGQRPPLTEGRSRAARKLNFWGDDFRDHHQGPSNESPLGTGRDVEQLIEPVEGNETLNICSYMLSLPQTSSTVGQLGLEYRELCESSSTEDFQDMEEMELPRFDDSNNRVVSSDSDLLDGELECRESKAAIDILNSSSTAAEPRDVSQNLQSITDVMVNLNLQQFESTQGSSRRVKRSESIIRQACAPKIKFKSSVRTDVSVGKTQTSNVSMGRPLNPLDLEQLRYMLETCDEIHPCDSEPRKPCPTPLETPIKSLMDGGDAVDVRSLASRLSRMNSECNMKTALREYVHTHIPNLKGRADGIIESTVQQIAAVSLKDYDDVSNITSTSDWLNIQEGRGGSNYGHSSQYHHGNTHWNVSGNQHNNSGHDAVFGHKQNTIGKHPHRSIDGRFKGNTITNHLNNTPQNIFGNVQTHNSETQHLKSNSPTFHSQGLYKSQVFENSLVQSQSEIIELDSDSLQHHLTVTPNPHWSKSVAEVRNVDGTFVHSEYVSPEEKRFTSLTDRKRKRKIQEVEPNPEQSSTRSKRKGKKKVAFNLAEDVSPYKIMKKLF